MSSFIPLKFEFHDMQEQINLMEHDFLEVFDAALLLAFYQKLVMVGRIQLFEHQLPPIEILSELLLVPVSPDHSTETTQAHG